MHGVRVPMWQTQSAGPVTTAHMSVLWLWTLCHTTQHGAVLIIFPLNLQTITITWMLSSDSALYKSTFYLFTYVITVLTLTHALVHRVDRLWWLVVCLYPVMALSTCVVIYTPLVVWCKICILDKRLDTWSWNSPTGKTSECKLTSACTFTLA